MIAALAGVAGVLAFFAVDPGKPSLPVPAPVERRQELAAPSRPPTAGRDTAEAPAPDPISLGVVAEAAPRLPVQDASPVEVTASLAMRMRASGSAAVVPGANAAAKTSGALPTEPPAPGPAGRPVDLPAIAAAADVPLAVLERAAIEATEITPPSRPPEGLVAASRPAPTAKSRPARRFTEPQTTGSTRGGPKARAVRTPARPAPAPEAAPFSLPGALRPNGS